MVTYKANVQKIQHYSENKGTICSFCNGCTFKMLMCIHVYLCVWACICVWVCVCVSVTQRVFDLEWEFQGPVSHLMWLLGTNPEPSFSSAPVNTHLLLLVSFLMNASSLRPSAHLLEYFANVLVYTLRSWTCSIIKWEHTQPKARSY